MKRVSSLAEPTLAMFDEVGLGVSVWSLEDERDNSSLILEHVNSSNERLKGKRIDEAMPYLRSTGAPAALARVVRSGVPERLGYIWYTDVNFARAWYALAAFPALDHRVIVLYENITANQRAGQSLTFPSQLLQTIEQAIIATDADSRIIFWNRFAERLSGWTIQEVIDKPIGEVAFAAGSEASGLEVVARIRDGHSWVGELLMKRKDGSEFPAFAALAPIVGESEVCGVVGVFYDITEQKRREESTRKSEILQRPLPNIVPDRIFRIDEQMRYLDYFGPPNELNVPVSGLIGKTVREILPPELADRVEAAIRGARAERRPVRLEYELEIQGELRSYETMFAPGVDDEVVAVSRDVTEPRRDRERLHRVLADLERRVVDRTAELQRVNTSLIALMERRRAAEYALRESYSRLQLLVDGSPAAIVELDRQGHVLSWSGAAERMFGWSAAEAIGRYNPTVPHERMGESLALLEAFSNGGSVDSLPLVRQTRDGRMLQVTMSTSALHGEAGEIDRYILVYNRVEDHVSANVEELTRRMRELTFLSRSITRSLDLNEAMLTMQRELARLFDIRSGVLLLANEGQLEERFAWGAELGTARAMAMTGEEEIGFVVDPLTGRQWLRAPLFDAGDEAGVLLLEVPTSPFDGDLNMVRDVAREVTAAVTNARLFDAVRRGNERLQELSRRLVVVQENERRHLGRELHDQIGQMLTGLKLSLAAVRNSGVGHASLADAEELVGDLMNRIRTLSLELRPPMLDDAGLLSALTWHVGRYAEQTGVSVDFRHGEIGRLDADIETAAFRIVQEAMTNAARHGDARRLLLRLWLAADRLLVEIEDDGVGFAAAGPPRIHTAGLTGMRERAHLVGGTIAIESTPGSGTRVVVDLPIASDAGNTYVDSHPRR